MSKDPLSFIDTFLNDLRVEPEGEAFGEITKGFTNNNKFLEEVAGHSNHTAVPGTRVAGNSGTGAWETKAVREATGDSILSDAFMSLKEGDRSSELKKKELTDNEAKMRVDTLLNLGYSPSKVAEYIKKMAEIKVFDTQSLGEYLKSQTGALGLSYIEPNFYMNSCLKSAAKIKKEGRLRALSVKKVAACDGCSYYKNGCNCALYRLPIVASASELKSVALNAVEQKGLKTASLKAGLTQLHEGTGQERSALSISRVETPTATRTAGDKATIVEHRKEASVKEIQQMLATGIPIDQVYKNASAQYGKVSASSAIKKFINTLKQSKTKIVLAAIDCTLLKGKLATGNAIVGEKKCASCTYRNGMHCGLTGGTLLSFPGMNTVASNKISHEGVKDGREVLFEFDLLDTPENSIEYIEAPDVLDVELTQSSKVDLND